MKTAFGFGIFFVILGLGLLLKPIGKTFVNIENCKNLVDAFNRKNEEQRRLFEETKTYPTKYKNLTNDDERIAFILLAITEYEKSISLSMNLSEMNELMAKTPERCHTTEDLISRNRENSASFITSTQSNIKNTKAALKQLQSRQERVPQ